MKHWLTALILVFFGSSGLAQQLIFPDTLSWNSLYEGTSVSFKIGTTDPETPKFSLEGVNEYRIQFDTLGNFSWNPRFDLVDRLEKQKEVNMIVQAEWKDGRRIRKTLTFIISHQNRPPVVEDLPVFYVKQAAANTYQIPGEYVNDPDGDPLVFKSIQSQLPEGVTLSSSGLLTWTPSRNQFNSLKNNPIQIEFIAQDQPEKSETKGKIKIAQTQLDLPPEMLLVPGDTSLTIEEDERINFKIYVSDPNGDENIANVGFVCSDNRIMKESFIQNTSVQSEFTWSPGYYFVEESEKVKAVEIIFFALDKSTNRVQRKVLIKVLDTENLDEKDKFLYLKYRNSLVQAKSLIDLLDNNHEKLNKAYKQAKKGKKNRSILNASLGATTGLAPIAINDPSAYKTVAAVGGTTVMTLGTLEATEVIGKSKSDILEKMKVNVEIRNQLQLEGDNFARKYALKSTRRNKDFDADRDKLLPIINNQKLVILELDASKPTPTDVDNKDLKKTFPDFSDQ
jgi:Putative Ig domain